MITQVALSSLIVNQVPAYAYACRCLEPCQEHSLSQAEWGGGRGRWDH